MMMLIIRILMHLMLFNVLHIDCFSTDIIHKLHN